MSERLAPLAKVDESWYSLEICIMMKIYRRLKINVGKSCAPFVKVPERSAKLCIGSPSLPKLGSVGERQLRRWCLSNGGERVPDARNAMVTLVCLA